MADRRNRRTPTTRPKEQERTEEVRGVQLEPIRHVTRELTRPDGTVVPEAWAEEWEAAAEAYGAAAARWVHDSELARPGGRAETVAATARARGLAGTPLPNIDQPWSSDTSLMQNLEMWGRGSVPVGPVR